MIKTLLLLCLPLLGYLMGSLSSAIIVSKLMGMDDPRSVGSGNPGATNVLRSGNKTAAALTLAGDIAKGIIPVMIAAAISPHPWLIALTGLGAFLGHLYPVFFGFKGGKGVATAIGVIMGISLKIAALIILVWIILAATTRLSSLAALVAATTAPIFFAFFGGAPAYVVLTAVLAGLLAWRHRENIKRLQQGTESRIKF